MARRRSPPTKLFGSAELTDFSKDLGFVKPADLLEAVSLAKQFVFDLETTGLNPRADRIDGLAIHVPAVGKLTRPLRAWYPFNPFTFMCHLTVATVLAKWELFKEIGVDLDQLSEAIKDKQPDDVVLCDLRPPMEQEVTMNGLRPIWETLTDAISIAAQRKFDDGFLYYASGTTEPIVMNCITGDSMLADFCSDERRMKYGLKTRVKQEFGHDMTTYAEAVRGAALLSFCDAKPLGVYAMDDCEWTWKLHERALDRLRTQTPAGKRTELAWAVEKTLGRPMGKLERIYWGIDCKISSIIMEMENAGVLIDWRWLIEVEEKIDKEQAEIAVRIEKYLGWPLNPNSGKQVADALFAPPPDGLGLPMAGIPIGKAGDPSTSDKVIKHFARFHPLVSDILKWRSLDTVKGGFVKKLIKLATASENGRIYGHFNQTRTVIARLSSSDPINFQNQPRDKDLVRRAYCAYREGVDEPEMVLLGGDYGQIELRVAAHLANEANMIEVYQMGGICAAEAGQACPRYKVWSCEESGCGHSWTPEVWSAAKHAHACPKCGGQKTEHQARCRHVDLHQRTADDAQVKRNPLAKNLNFGLLYRMGAPKFCVYADLFDADGMPMVDFAKDVIGRWHGAYPSIAPFHDVTEYNLERDDWIAETLFGRRRRLDQEMRINRFRAVTQGIQFKVSGSAQDIMKAGMIRVVEERNKKIANARPAERALWKRFKILMQIHDELISEVPAAIKAEASVLMKTAMEGIAKGHLRVPLAFAVKTGKNWDEIH